MLDLVRLHRPIKKELQAAFEQTLDSGRFIGGPVVTQFEQALANYCDVDHAVAVSSGTDALLSILMALELKPGDEVITTPFTFISTASTIARLGAVPVFADIERDSFNIDPNCILEKITKKTVGIIPVHLFGNCADMKGILAIAKEKKLWVVEDAAQSIGACQNGKKSGSMGIAGAFSFFPAKNLGALGDGGAVVTNDEQLADKLRRIRNHGAQNPYYYQALGGNFRLDALQAAFLSIKLRRLKEWETGRRRVACLYNSAFKDDLAISTIKNIEQNHHVYNQYVVRVKKRDALQEGLKHRNIASAIYYPRPLHLQACFKYLGNSTGDYPESEMASKEVLALPVDPCLEKREQEQVIIAVHDILTKAG